MQSCVITINDDGSKLERNKKFVSEFDINDLGETKSYKTKDDIRFQTITGANIQEVISKEQKTWVYVWGSWCSPCIEKLPRIVELDALNPDMTILLISEDYHIESLQNLLFKNQYSKVPYLLDSETYGDRTREKIKILQKELGGGLEFEHGFPQNYFFNNEEIVLYEIGALSDEDYQKCNIKLQ